MTTDVTTTANTENDKSERRKMVVQMVSAGVPRSDIAQQLGVSVSTVHSDMKSYSGAEERGIHQIAREVIDELIIDRERIRRQLTASLRHLDKLLANDDTGTLATNDFPGIRLLATMSAQLAKQLNDWLETTVSAAPRERAGDDRESSGVSSMEDLRETILRSPAVAGQLIEAGIDDALRCAQEKFQIRKRQLPDSEVAGCS
jgi:predicted transcriptional regulator